MIIIPRIKTFWQGIAVYQNTIGPHHMFTLLLCIHLHQFLDKYFVFGLYVMQNCTKDRFLFLRIVHILWFLKYSNSSFQTKICLSKINFLWKITIFVHRNYNRAFPSFLFTTCWMRPTNFLKGKIIRELIGPKTPPTSHYVVSVMATQSSTYALPCFLYKLHGECWSQDGLILTREHPVETLINL